MSNSPAHTKNCPQCRASVYSELETCPHCQHRFTNDSSAGMSLHTSRIGKIAIDWNWRTLCNRKALLRLAKYIGAIAVLIFSYQYFFIYSDPETGCYIKIRPGFTELSNLTMKDGMRYLKEHVPEEYKNTCDHVTTIHPRNGCGGFGGGCFSRREPEVIVISTANGAVENAAKVIIHETCHVMQYKFTGETNEPDCYALDDAIPWHGPDGLPRNIKVRHQ